MYRAGDYYVICDTCGLRYYRSQCVKDHQGFIVCKSCYDPRHPQEKIRTISERNIVKDARPEGDPVFLQPGDVTAEDL